LIQRLELRGVGMSQMMEVKRIRNDAFQTLACITLDQTRENDLVTEFSAIRASQRPQTDLKGIRAEADGRELGDEVILACLIQRLELRGVGMSQMMEVKNVWPSRPPCRSQ
jgi:hypothetical protein